jgi:hypothetical protein
MCHSEKNCQLTRRNLYPSELCKFYLKLSSKCRTYNLVKHEIYLNNMQSFGFYFKEKETYLSYKAQLVITV